MFVHDRLGALAGAEVNLRASAAELKRRGHTVALVHGPGTGRDETAWRELFPGRFSLSGANRTCAVEAALQAFRPDLVYVHNMADLQVLGALVDAGVPVVRMVHDHTLYCMRSYKYRVLSRQICTRAFSPYCVLPCGAFLARAASGALPVRWVSYAAKKRELELNQQFRRLLVASRYMRDELLRNGFTPEKIEIHPPVPGPRDAAPPGTFDAANRLVYAGQIERGKGVDVLLESLALVRAPFECVILGDGRHRHACERLSRRLGLEGRVRFKGFVPQSEVGTHYRSASVAVLSSVWPEPFGAVGLEAMRCGLPVVAFDAGGISEWLLDGVNGFLVPWMDRAGFAGRVEDLLRNKSLAREMGARGLQLVTEKYGFRDYIDRLEGLFTRLAPITPCVSTA
jgi:glycosyltransferase involved in cell wall biosynthesis